MSSAILYLAIVAIWAVVLIPRWLRRDSARGVPAQAPAPVAAQPDAESAGGSLEDRTPEDGRLEYGPFEDGPFEDGPFEDVGEVVAPARTAEPLRAEGGRPRMHAARRRLLLMLTGLQIAAITLAVLRLAAIWVVVPPSVMLVGYLALLREAARADAECALRDSEAAAAARAMERARARRSHSRPVDPVEGTPSEGTADTAAALAAKFAAAPVPADYEDSGRDFAPGLAGKYMTSNAEAEPAKPAEPDADADAADDDDYYYETYDQPPLRAVGD